MHSSQTLRLYKQNAQPLLQPLLDTFSAVVSHRLIHLSEAPSRAGSGSALPCNMVLPACGMAVQTPVPSSKTESPLMLLITGHHFSCVVWGDGHLQVFHKERGMGITSETMVWKENTHESWVCCNAEDSGPSCPFHTKWQGSLAESTASVLSDKSISIIPSLYGKLLEMYAPFGAKGQTILCKDRWTIKC